MTARLTLVNVSGGLPSPRSPGLAGDWYLRARIDLRKARRARDAGDVAKLEQCVADFQQARGRARMYRAQAASRRAALRQLENGAEVSERAAQVHKILASCLEELERLEEIPTGEIADLEAISMAKGFVERARFALGARFA